jgi:hypothetical protein
VSAKKGASAMNLKEFRIDYAKSLCKLQIKTTACKEVDHRVLTTEEQGHSVSFLNTRYVRTHPGDHWPLWMDKRATCIHADHTAYTCLIGKISIESWLQKGEKL